MKIYFLVLFFAICLPTVWAQITQSHPEYCGISAATPPNVSATVDPNSGDAVLNIGSSQSGIPLLIGTLPSFITRISEICTLPDGRLVAFGDLIKYPDAAVIFIVDPAKNSLVDSFTTYRPLAISPNQRWLVFGKFCSVYEKGCSAEYLIYDFSKAPVDNRPGSADANEPGRIIYPPGHENFPGSMSSLPANYQHAGGSVLYWSSDSRSMVFKDVIPSADVMASDPGIVLVNLDDQGTASAFRHRLTPSEICGGQEATINPYAWVLNRADFGSDHSTIRLEISATGEGSQLGAVRRCAPQALLLRQEEFQPAAIEVHATPQRRKTIRVNPGEEVVSPQKK